MDKKILVLLAFALLISGVNGTSLSMIPNSFIMSNSIISSNGQLTIANTIISGGSQTSYSGAWTLYGSNSINATLTSVMLNTGNGAIQARMSPSGKQLYVSNYGSATISVISTSTNAVVATISGVQYARSFAVTPSGKELIVGNDIAGSTNVVVVDVATNTIVKTIYGFNRPLDVAISNNGMAYVSNYGEEPSASLTSLPIP